MNNAMPLTSAYHAIEYADITSSAIHEVIYLLEECQADAAKTETHITILRSLVYSLNRDMHHAKEVLGLEAVKELERHRPKHRSQAVAEEVAK